MVHYHYELMILIDFPICIAAGYKTHTDCLVGNGDPRDRFATILVYLKDVQKGGETEFPGY